MYPCKYVIRCSKDMVQHKVCRIDLTNNTIPNTVRLLSGTGKVEGRETRQVYIRDYARQQSVKREKEE